jgi:hypothetical protein
MTAPHIVDPAGLLGEALAEASPDLMRSLLQTVINALLSADVDAVVGAEWGQRTPGRLAQRNGYRHRDLDTRVGTIDVAIPKLRSGTYFPEWLLERRKRSEAALITVVADCYLAGVSTRRMDKLVKTLGINTLSKSQVSRMATELDAQVEAFRHRPLDAAGPFTFVAADALTMKVREAGRVINAVVLLATGVNGDGHREVLGMRVVQATTERPYAVVTARATDGEQTAALRVYRIIFGADPVGSCDEVTSPWQANSWSSTGSACQSGDGDFRVTDSGTGAWTNKDNLTTVWQPERLGVGDSVQTTVTDLQRGDNSDSRAGVIVRNDLSTAGKGSALGYVTLAVSPSGVYLQHDQSSDGFLDTETAKLADGVAPVQVRLERTTTTTMTGYYRLSADDEWTTVATVPVQAPDERLDAGIYATANNGAGPAVATFTATAFSAPETTAGVAAEASLRCVGGKMYVTARLTNTGTEPAELAVTSPYGSKTFAQVQPGKSASVALPVRAASTPGGTVTATATDDSSTATTTAEFPAGSCG